MLDPVINFKMKQKVKFFGACMTVGVDYLSDLAHWRLHYSMEVYTLKPLYAVAQLHQYLMSQLLLFIFNIQG